MNKTKLAKAIAMTLTGTALSIGGISNASAHVMYNTYNAFAVATDFDENGTDGWTRVDGAGNSGTPVAWVGTAGGARPFGYNGNQALNWAAAIHSTHDTHEISQAHAQATYGIYADIDTANGAWGAWQVDPENPTFTRGWAHNTDYGLLKSDVDAVITLSAESLNGGIQNFGFTVFTGMDDNTSSYSHHSAWNIGYVSGTNEAPAQVNNPHGTKNLSYLTHSDSGDLTFTAFAGQIYSIYLGGNDLGGGIFGPNDGYKLNITATSPVPVPAAAWLLGSGLIGLISYGRKRNENA